MPSASRRVLALNLLTADNCRWVHPSAQNVGGTNNRFGPLARKPDSPYRLDKDIIRRDLTDDRPQWILSAYGPGRDPPEQLFGGPAREQSFEEARLYYMQGLAAGNPQGALQDLENSNLQAQQAIQQAAGNVDAAVQFIVDAGNKHPNRIDICQGLNSQTPRRGVFERGKPRDPAFGGQAKPGAFGAPSQPAAFGAAAPKPGAFGAPSGPTTGAFGAPSQQPAPGAFGAPSQPAAGAFGAPTQPASGAFGAPSQPAAGAFGQAPALGQKVSPWGGSATSSPAFGQPSQPGAAGGFGQTPQLGAKPNPWGAPAQSSTAAPAFGQPSQPTPAFGQPSQPAGPAFGQPSQPGAAGGFGQAPQLGAKPNPWGAPAQSTAAPAFGQPSQPAAGGFGQPAATGAKPNPFGQPSQAAPPAANPFGQPSAPPAAANNPFGQAQAQPAATNPFGQAQAQPAASNPFGQPTQQQQPPAASNPFGQTQTQPAKPNPFGAAQAPAGAPTGPAGFNAAPAPPTTTTTATTNTYGPKASKQHPPLESYAAKNPDGSLRMFKGRAVQYQVLPPGSENGKLAPVISLPGGIQKIWFPSGPPSYNRDTEATDEKVYEDPKVLAQWEGFVKNGGRFADGIMPEVPPKREWCVWDF